MKVQNAARTSAGSARIRRTHWLAAAALAAVASNGHAATPNWLGATSDDWFDSTNWSTAAVPNGGDVATFPAAASVLNNPRIDPPASAKGLAIDNSGGNVYVFNGTGTLSLGSAGISITGSGPNNFLPAINIATPQTWSLDPTSKLILTRPIQGISPITFEGGGITDFQYGENNFAGGFVINNGTLTSTNFSDSPSRAFRSNRITLGPNGILATQGLSLGSVDTGEISGSGTLDTTANASGLFVIALNDATFSGTLKIGSSGSGITVRGIASQTFTGDTSAAKGPPAVTEHAELILAGNAAFLDNVANSYFARGGHMILDDSIVNLPNRLNPTGNLDDRGSTDNVVQLIGNTNGSSQTFSNLVLNNGALKLKIVHNAGAAAPTLFNFTGNFNRAGTQATVDFSATGGVLGSGDNAPRIMFPATGTGTNGVILLNGTIASGTNANASVGFATVNKITDFASYDNARGVIPVTTTPFPAAADPTANALLTSSATADNGLNPFALNTLKIQPSATGQSLDITSPGGLSTGGIMLVGPNSFTISSSGLGPVTTAGGNTRYYYVSDPNATLNISANVAPAGTVGPITKDGPGTLFLSGINTFELASGTSAININILDGVLRATSLSLLNSKTVLRFRGGVFELVGGGLINRQVGNTSAGTNGAVNWFGGASSDSGSGGFSAAGGSAVVNLDNPLVADTYAWGSSASFLSAGYSLVFGSKTADSVVEWQDNINLSAPAAAQQNNDRFYNLREIRVIDNPNSTGDKALFSGAITSNDASHAGANADLMKTGDGILELANANNNYLGNTIVAGGTLILSGNATNSANFLLKSGQFTVNGAVNPNANFLLTGGNATFSSARVSLGAVNASAGTLALTTSANHNAKVLTVKSLSISGSGKVDLANNGMIVDYPKGDPSPITSIRALLRSAYAGGSWTGPGLTSSAAAAHGATAIGYGQGNSGMTNFFPGDPIAIDDSSIVLRYTVYGDATLDGKVDFTDLVALAQNYGFPADKVWTQGDFNYDGIVDFPDLVVLAQAYGSTLAPAQPIPGATPQFEADLAKAFAAAVPEPTIPATLALVAAFNMTRRRRKE